MKLAINLRPLSSNQAWQGRRFKTPDYHSFERDVSLLLPFNKTPIEGRLEVRYRFYLKNHSRSDYDNCIKSLQDVLVKLGYISDDRKIYKAVIEKIPSGTDRIEVEIIALE